MKNFGRSRTFFHEAKILEMVLNKLPLYIMNKLSNVIYLTQVLYADSQILPTI